MIPFGNETVTLVQRTETVAHGKTHAAYAVTTLTGCSWQRTQRWNREACLFPHASRGDRP